MADPWYSRRYKDARSNMVVKELTFIDFALAMGIKYLDRKEILERWKRASYETLARIFKAKDRYFFLDGCLQVLILDYYHSTKYLLEKVMVYARLPPELRKEVIINVLVFSETKKAQLARAITKYQIVTVRILKANWKY